jgi:hypothetical protein
MAPLSRSVSTAHAETGPPASGSAEVDNLDRLGEVDKPNLWDSNRAAIGCSEEALRSSDGAGLFYCYELGPARPPQEVMEARE